MLAVPHGASRRQLAATAGPATAFAVLLVVTAFDGGAAHAASGGALAATLPLLALLGALVVVVQGAWPFPRLPRPLWLALGCFALWAAAAFASMAWSLSAAASWTDGVRVLSALAAVAGGAWLGSVLRRPLEAACLALIAAAWPILGWAVVQRSFGSLDRFQATPRLSQPFGYPNAVGIFSVVVAVVALWLATRPPARGPGGRRGDPGADAVRLADDRLARVADRAGAGRRPLRLAAAAPRRVRRRAGRGPGGGHPCRRLDALADRPERPGRRPAAERRRRPARWPRSPWSSPAPPWRCWPWAWSTGFPRTRTRARNGAPGRQGSAWS